MFDDPNVVLHCEKIDKIYPGTKALDQVSFCLLYTSDAADEL